MAVAKEKKTLVEPKHVVTLDLPTSHTDGVNIGVRADGLVFLQFFSETPEKAIENHRTMMKHDSAVQLIEALAKALDHYPQKTS